MLGEPDDIVQLGLFAPERHPPGTEADVAQARAAGAPLL